MLYRLILFICLPVVSLISSSVDDTTIYSVGPMPNWVKECSFSIEPIAIKSSQVNLQYLLIDMQHHWEEKTRYSHMAMRVLSQAGVEKSSQFTIDFDPSYQRVIVHTVRVIRNGKSLDRLGLSRQKLLQREADLENNLYSGNYTLVYFLDDVRVGDIMEYAWLVVGAHPVFSTHFSDMVMLQNQATTEKLFRRILICPHHLLRMKSFNTSQEPCVRDLSSTLQEWSWEVTDPAPFKKDAGQPSWYNSLASVQLSQYGSWQEVIEKIIPLYKLPEGFLRSPLSDIVALIEIWKKSSDPVQRALFALRFVQDEIRYLGFEDGLGSHKPTDPEVVFQRRFGDCKDKTLLLQALIQLMGIPSKPVLVHSKIGRRLPEFLPTPHVFNHVILRIDIENKSYFVDPTLTPQGGCLQDNFLPDFHWGLPIADEGITLIPLPRPPLEKTLKIDTSIILTSPSSAEMKIDWTYSGFKADMMRKVLRKGLKQISEDYLETIQRQYRGAMILSLLKISDDTNQNILILSGSYKVPIRTHRGKKNLKIPSQIIEIYLDGDINLDRASPYQLIYPQWVTEHIHIENPFNDWAPDSDEVTLKHESLNYHYSLKKEGHIADIDWELKHLKDHVFVDAIQEYWDIISEVEANPSLELTIPAEG
jgi:hypothetical protein